MGNEQREHALNKRERVGRWLLVILTLVLLVVISGGTLILRGYVQRVNSSSGSPLSSGSLTPQPIFEDTFTSNKNGWYIGQSAGYTRLLTNGGLMLEDTNHTMLVESLPIIRQFKDVTVTTTLTFVSGDKQDSIGLYVRGDRTLDHDYRVEIFGDNTYAISKESIDARNGQEMTFLVPATGSPLLKPIGQANTLALTMDGPLLTLAINGKVASQVTDTEYTSGQIALFVSNDQSSDGVIGLFHSISITPVTNDQNALASGPLSLKFPVMAGSPQAEADARARQ